MIKNGIKKSTTLLALFVIFLTMGVSIDAQDRESQKEKMKAMKVGFITEQLELTADEAQDFWPIYNEYQDAKDALKVKYKGNASSEAYVQKKKEEAELVDSYNKQFQNVISEPQVGKLFKAEMDFSRKVLQKKAEMRKNKAADPANKPAQK